MSFADFAKDVLPWICSTLTIWMTHLQGKKSSTSWLVGLANQVLWLAFAIGTRTWGLILLNIFLWYLYARNYIQWRRDERTPEQGNPIHGLQAGLAMHRVITPVKAALHVCGAHGMVWQEDCNACRAAQLDNRHIPVPRLPRGTL